MALVKVSNVQFHIGLSTDVKPSAPAGSKFFETDTRLWYLCRGGATWALDPHGGSLQGPLSVTKALAAAGDYTADDVLSESASAGTAWVFDAIVPENALSGYIVKAHVISETTGLTPRLTLFLFTVTPTSELDDNKTNTALLSADLANYVGKIDFPAMEELGGDSEALATPSTSGNLPLAFTCAAGDDALFGVLVTRDAVTAEVATDDMTVRLTVELA